MKRKRMEWVGHAARVVKLRNAYRNVVGKLEWKTLLEISTRRL